MSRAGIALGYQPAVGKVTSEAIALRRTPFGETSQIAEFLTRHEGRVTLMLKGVHRPRARKGGGVDLLDVSRLTYMSRRRSRSMPMLTERILLGHHPALRRRNDLMLAGQYLVELLRAVTPEGQPVPGIFRLSLAYLEALESQPSGEALPAVVFAMEGGILRMTGFQPVLDRCVSCGRRPDGFRTLRCDPAKGGIVCSACRSPEDDVFDVTSIAAQTILQLTGPDPRKMVDIVLPTEVVNQVRGFYDRYFIHVLERRPRCLLMPVGD